MTLDVYQRLGVKPEISADCCITLDHLQRDRGRLRTSANDGSEVRIFLERGKPLLVGELLQSECGKFIKVVGAEELVTTARCDNWITFSRACYHLGNRHVKLQIANNDEGGYWLRITPDHVLEEMLELLGLALEKELAVFIPESGAYRGGHGHSHGHDSGHSHSLHHRHEQHEHHHH
ncbi:urease accessory protein UreE [Microbulbifer harenosus]|uniref:urease accessory protein UreE n=1 Tax=Microbulbifer harenosus TaxID=2576840 RepID=UPI001C6FE568|nr:urease accessory protein UreE [Microbulbifer harenosus]